MNWEYCGSGFLPEAIFWQNTKNVCGTEKQRNTKTEIGTGNSANA